VQYIPGAWSSLSLNFVWWHLIFSAWSHASPCIVFVFIYVTNPVFAFTLIASDQNYRVASAGNVTVESLGNFNVYLLVISPHPFHLGEAFALFLIL